MAKQHDKQFKLDAVQYYLDHKELGVRGCAQNLGVGYSTLTKWLKDFRESGDIPVRGSGNYASDEQKEIARLKRELRDAQDALDVLKKPSAFWENNRSHLPRGFRKDGSCQETEAPGFRLRNAEIFRRFPIWISFVAQPNSF